jgi:putative ATP-dependent endonuclease of the OLD family
MRIGKIRIENFRSIKSADIQSSEFNIFVGQNNHGKTNLFEALDWFHTGAGDPDQIVYERDRSKDFLVELESWQSRQGLSR